MKGVAALIAAAIIIILGVSFFAMRNRNAPKTASPQTQQSPVSQETNQAQPAAPQPSSQNSTPRVLEIALGAQNNSGETGKAELSESNGKTKVELTLVGFPKDIPQPAHIHIGSCANLGAVKYPLSFPVNGKSETVLDVPLSQILNELPLAINVHKSATEASVYVSCGDIPGSASNSNSSNVSPSTGQGAANPAVSDDRNGGGGQFSTPTDRRRGADKPED